MRTEFWIPVVAIVAFVAGRWSAPDPTPVTSTRVVDVRGAAPAPAVPPRASPKSTPAAASSARCESQLAIATKLLEAQQRAAQGEPVEFPPDVAPQYTPQGFTRAVEDALEACDSALSIAHVDCLEFPCVVFFDQPGGSQNQGVGDLASCTAWSDRFGNGGRSNSSFMTDDGPVEYSSLAPRPPDSRFDDNSMTRWKNRLEAGRLELMSAWGGREFTERESLQNSLTFWEEQGHDEMAAEIRAQLDALKD